MSIWDYAKEKLAENNKKSEISSKNETDDVESNICRENNEDTHVVIFGSRNCGKSSLILRFLEKDEQPKPTIALEYTYGRRSKGSGKEVGHIWELAGNLKWATLLNVPINNRNIGAMSLVLVIDLSTPEEMWSTLETFLPIVKHRIHSMLKDGNLMKEKLHAKAWAKFNSSHLDRNFIDPVIIPLAMVGAKYDKFQEMSLEKRTLICKTLRFIAHTNGSSLMFYSSKIESLVSRGRALLSYLLFGTNPSKGMVTDPNKPLFIQPGSDSLAEIGLPQSASNILAVPGSPLEIWKSAFCTVFPQNKNQEKLLDDSTTDQQYKEDVVDLLRAQKDKELENYIRQRSRETTIKMA